MVAVPASYSPVCVVCGTAARCQCPWIEGVVRRVERREQSGPHGRFTAVHLQLQTAQGPCVLLLGARFAYLAEGLAEAPEGVVIRAYHLKFGRQQETPLRETPDTLADGGLPPEEWPLESAAARSTRPPHTPPISMDTLPRRGLPRYVTDAESLVVVEPDWLVDVTALNGITYCLRQWLANRLAAQSGSLQMVRGTVVHACFETLCRDGSLPPEFARRLASRYAENLALIGASTEELLAAVAPHLERLQEWRTQFADELFADTTAIPCYETTLICPELGLRGRVDLAMRHANPDGPPLVSRVVELKTGKYNENWPDPEFQVRGYYAILAGQQRLAPDFKAQVIYTGSPAIQYRHIPCGPEHVLEVLANRNQAVLALLLGHAPPPSSQKRCRSSVSRADCVRLSALLGLDHCRGRDLADAAAGDGDPRDAQFYAEQYRLLRLEGRASSHALAALWRTSAGDREAAGAAIAVLAEDDRRQDADGRWHYRLQCHNRSELRAGETVLLSDGDPIRGEVTVATLLSAGARQVELAASEPIAQPLLIDTYENNNAQDRTLRGLHAWLQAPNEIRALLYAQRHPETGGYEQRRAPATTGEQLEDGTARQPQGFPSAGDAALNVRQADALDLALRARDYLLVQGPPGTGKTYLIARMVRALIARGDRVLLAAWTNQAVDTILQALLAQGCTEFSRLGSSRSIDPRLAPYLLVPQDLDGERGDGDPCAIAERLRGAPILAGTVSSLADPNITAATLRRDVLILDEAAQLSVASAVGALRLARRFILVGDDQQLPPVVQSEEAAREGLSLSPFAMLRPEAQAAGLLVTLTEQFRMHEAIAAWPSAAFYDNKLRAHPSVAARRLPEPTGPVASTVTDREDPLVLVDAGPVADREAELAARAVLALVRSGVPAAQVGVVAPFRSKVAAVRRMLEDTPETAGCLVDTVDRFQGGQREAMVVCLGLDGMGRRGHAFVDDPRRLNVAFTRARAKLVVVGDLTAAVRLPTLAGFLHHCQEHGVPIVRATGRARSSA